MGSGWTLALLAASTLVSEDAACAAAGALVARQAIPLPAAVLACWAGIVAGDVLLYLSGRGLARWPAMAALSSRLASAASDTRARGGLRRYGPAIFAAVRFLPGLRLPTYVAAGLLGTGLASFTAWVGIGAALSTPLLVIASAAAGSGASRWASGGAGGWIAVFGVALLAVALFHGAARLATWRGRRLLIGRWRRLTRFEFWPPWLFYLPIVPYLIRLAVRHRSVTLFTAANPAIPGGGLVGESKAAILDDLQASGAPVAPYIVIHAGSPPADRVRGALHFAENRAGGFPVVVKPDVGERGRGVAIARDAACLEALVREAEGDLIVQRFVPGPELGVFYVRRPGERSGRIVSITRKVMPEVTGDGRSTLERLILQDERAVCMARLYLDRMRERLGEIPGKGARVPLAEIGSHSRGAIFLDGRELHTYELAKAVDTIGRGYRGFHLGRFDLKAPSLQAFREGRGLTILELNGVGAEPTHIYDPSTRLRDAYVALRRQWRLAFAFGRANRDRGLAPLPLAQLARRLR